MQPLHEDDRQLAECVQVESQLPVSLFKVFVLTQLVLFQSRRLNHGLSSNKDMGREEVVATRSTLARPYRG